MQLNKRKKGFIAFYCQIFTEKRDTFISLDRKCLLKRLKKQDTLKITQLEKERFIKMNELKLTKLSYFSFFLIMRVAANTSELFSIAHLENIEGFLCYSNLSF